MSDAEPPRAERRSRASCRCCRCKGTVVFPGAVAPLSIGEERSVRLIDDVVDSPDRLVVLVASPGPRGTEPGPELSRGRHRGGRAEDAARCPDGTCASSPRAPSACGSGRTRATSPYLWPRSSRAGPRRAQQAGGRPGPQHPGHLQPHHRPGAVPAGRAPGRGGQRRGPDARCRTSSPRRCGSRPPRSRSCWPSRTSRSACAASPCCSTARWRSSSSAPRSSPRSSRTWRRASASTTCASSCGPSRRSSARPTRPRPRSTSCARGWPSSTRRRRSRAPPSASSTA